jgi:predicted enzyme related to lactoylglutathione lyase
MVEAFFLQEGTRSSGGQSGMIVGVRDVYYNAQDMRRALGFYRDIVGMRVLSESDHWSMLEIGGVRVGLESTEGAPVSRDRLAGAVLTLKSTDIREDVRRFKAKGVKFLSDIGDHEWGSVASFEDSEGNHLKILQDPH